MISRQCIHACIVLLVSTFAVAQPLDWSGDITLFGTSADEQSPALTIMPGGGAMRAVCVSYPLTLCMKISTDNGASWGVCATLSSPVQAPQMRITADRQYEYVLLSGIASANKTLFRLSARDNAWQSAVQHTVAPARTGLVRASAMISDEAAQLGDPYLNMAWIERESQSNNYSGWFVQSRDRGETFQAEQQLFAFTCPDASPEGIATAVSWNGSDERLIVAAPVDRPGFNPEVIRVFTSEDQGVTWADTTAVDEITYPQQEPSLAAYGSMVLLVYSRRVNIGIQRDIFMCYSPDGGVSFSPPIAITDSVADEHSPQVAINSAGDTFWMFYLADNGVDEPATVFVREGLVASPWIIGEPMMICEAGRAVRGGGIVASGGPLGVAASWAERFPLGDTDVKFDASWRGSAVGKFHAEHPTSISLEQNFPNPFNGSTILPLVLSRGAEVSIVVTDILGRHVLTNQIGYLSSGRHEIPLNTANLSSGVYWWGIRGVNAPMRKMILLK